MVKNRFRLLCDLSNCPRFSVKFQISFLPHSLALPASLQG
jgi:hypothetical protein